MPFTYEFPRPAVTADVVLFTMRAEDLAVLLVKRGRPPFKGAWALPGGFVEENEALEQAAARELKEETGIAGVPLEQLGAFGAPGRDPRGHTITVAFLSFTLSEIEAVGADDAEDAAWHPLRALPLWGGKPRTKSDVKLAFDHDAIIAAARRRLAERLDSPGLLPTRFTLTELQRVHEVVLGRTLDTRTFRRRLLARHVVEPVNRRRVGATQLYRFRVARRP